MKLFQIRSMSRFIGILVLATILVSCNDDNESVDRGEVILEFNAIMDGQTLELSGRTYDHAPGGSFVVDDFKYYISNIKLSHSGTGDSYTVTDGYYLVHKDQNYEDYEVSLDVVRRKYNQIEFSIGVDPARNLSIDNVGDLDPNNQMAWNWNSGYKFMLLEGLFTDEQTNDIPLVFHIGADPNYRTYSLPLPSEIRVKESVPAKIMIQVEVEEFFENPNTIDFNTSNTIKHSPEASELADNYGTGMFSILNVE